MYKEPHFSDALNSGAGAISLTPFGRGFFSEDQEHKLTDQKKIDEITSASNAFQRNCGYSSPRTSDTMPHFLCKADFIIKNRQNDLSPRVLCALLADSRTLFSLSYQSYTASHPFYLDFRKEAGKDKQSQHQFCVKHAVSQCPQKKDIYTPILDELFAYASNNKRSVSSLLEQLIAAIFPAGLDELFFHVIEPAVQNLIAETTDISLRHLYLSYIQAVKNSSETRRAACLKSLSYYHLDGAQVLYQLKEWIPATSMSLQDASTFVCDCLRPYCIQEQQIENDKKAVGHFRESYRIADYSAYLNYKKNLDCLLNLTSDYRAGVSTDSTLYDLGDVKIFPQNRPKTPRTIESKIDLGKLSTAFKNYLKTYRKTASKSAPDSGYVAGAAEQIFQYCVKHNISDCFPFYCMLLFIAGKNILFSEGDYRILTFDEDDTSLRHIYRKKIYSVKRRYARINFLYAICCACEGLEFDSGKCWGLFWKYDGPMQLGREEEQWDEIFKTTPANFPGIKLRERIHERLLLCLPICEETQYCYSPASPLHLGKYAAFLHDHPDVLDRCVATINKNHEKWAGKIKEYLRQWSSAKHDPKQINLICAEIAKHQHWKGRAGFSDSELEVLLGIQASDCNFEQLVQELKRLLVESAIRKILNNQARDILKRMTYKGLLSAS